MDIHFQKRIASWYLAKVGQCSDSGMEFDLTLSQFSKLVSRKTCAYTGIKMTLGRGAKFSQRGSDLTIDRIDSSKGYVPGNVVACCHAANELKSKLENPMCCLTLRGLKSFVKKVNQ